MPRRRRRGNRSAARDAGVASGAVGEREQLVLIDTHIWIAFEKGDPAVREQVEELAAIDAACFIPPIWFELARGLSGPSAAFAHTLSQYATKFRFLPLTDADWAEALRLARLVAEGKHAVQMADALLAAVAVRTGAFVWSLDPDLGRLRAAEKRVRPFPTAL